MNPYFQSDAIISNREINSVTNSRHNLTILQEPNDITTSIGTYISLCTIVYSQSPSFQWYDESGKPIPNENEKDLFIGPVKREHFGFYKLEIVDKVTGERKYTRWTEIKELEKNRVNYGHSKPNLVVSPVGGIHEKGSTIHLFGAFDNVLEYQWYKDGEMLEGCRGNNLIISGCISENSGRYVLIAGNLGGIETTEEIDIIIK